MNFKTSKLLASILAGVIALTHLSCKKECDNSGTPSPERDSIYIKRVIILDATGQDTVTRIDFEYDSLKRPSKKIALTSYTKEEYLLYYDGKNKHPHMIIQEREDLSGGDNVWIDTSYLLYKDGYVSLDSGRFYNMSHTLQQRVRSYEIISPGKIRTISRRYIGNNIESVSTTYSTTVWNSGNLVRVLDTTYSSLPTSPYIFTSDFTYDNAINPFKRISIPYLFSAVHSIGLEDLSHLSITVNPGTNNFTSRTSYNGYPITATYQYNANNLPVSAQTSDGFPFYIVKYIYTD